MGFIWHNGLFMIFGLALVTLALWLGLRYHTKTKSRTVIQPKQILISTAIKRPARVISNQDQSVVAYPQKNVAEKLSNDDSILEAELYSNHGRPASAIKILLEVVNRHPSNEVAWSLLLSNYSSLGKAVEFEKTAQEFLSHHKASPLWTGIQALGRTLDQKNPLYIGNNNNIPNSQLLTITSNSRRPVGDILIEMGVLTEQDVQSRLDDFVPVLHGRFGGYLLTHRVITLAQLDQALLLQQR